MDLAAKKILIVDDEKRFLLSLADGLDNSGKEFHILIANNGEKALRVLETVPVDLVITDLKMPGMDGFEFISRMKKNHRDLPVIVMSAFLTPEIETRLSSLGVSQFTEKPLNIDVLGNLISNMIWKKT